MGMKISDDDIKEMEAKHVMSEFSRKRKLQYFFSGVTVVLIIAAALARSRSVPSLSTAYVWIMLVIAVGLIVFSFFNWRCPSCKKYMGRGYNIKNCPLCGVKLRK